MSNCPKQIPIGYKLMSVGYLVVKPGTPHDFVIGVYDQDLLYDILHNLLIAYCIGLGMTKYLTMATPGQIQGDVLDENRNFSKTTNKFFYISTSF